MLKCQLSFKKMQTEKLINFLNHNLNPRVVYNCVPDDLYKPENLISSSHESLNLGFMAYHVVKPPIDLLFNFSYKVDIHVIKLWLKFNLNVKTTGIELYAMFNNQFIKVGDYNSYLEMKNPNSSLPSSEGCFFYRSDVYLNYEGVPDNIRQIKFEKTFSLRSTKQIKVVLKYTNRCCVPVLKKIEVWGRPSRDCSKEEVGAINKIWNNLTASQTTLYNSNVAETTIYSLDEKKSSVNSIIPEEFLDSITYEIMTIPMVLPSGKLVDQITIERHTATEMTNGRSSSDPFTGLPFTSERKPIYDHALKLQIDEFLMKNQNDHEVKMMPRAIGRKRMQHVNDLLQCTSNQISINTLKPSSSLSTVSLDLLVLNAVKNIKRARVCEREIGKDCCSDCDKKFTSGSEITLYKILTCGHVICRGCLTNSKQTIKVCKLCSKEFTNCDLIKLNL